MDITLTLTLPVEDAQRVLALLNTNVIEDTPRAVPPPLSPPPVRTGDAAIIAGDPPPPLSPEVKARLDAAIAPPKEAVAAPGMTLEPVPPKRRVGRPRKDAAAAEAPRPKTWSKQGVPDGMSPEEFAEKKNLLKAQLFAVGHIRGMDFVQQVMDDWGGGKLSQVPFRDYDDVLNAALSPVKGWPVHPEEITAQELTVAMAAGAELEQKHIRAREAQQAGAS